MNDTSSNDNSTLRPDEVILLSETGRPIGTADRISVHRTDTPLHLAFSSYIFNASGQVLVTRRSLAKRTWPGVWSNSCCGHPQPCENIADAVRRRIQEELGLTVEDVITAKNDFRYTAADPSGILENEVCPVFMTLTTSDRIRPDASEVCDWAWLGWETLVGIASKAPKLLSPWAVLQIPFVDDARERHLLDTIA